MIDGRRRRLLAAPLLALLFAFWPFSSAYSADGPAKVMITTNLGKIEVVLDAKAAPKTVANFLRYVDEGYYAGTIFHRVIPGFMIQGGGFTTSYVRKETHAPIPNEAANGLHNDRGTIAMARTSIPDSATSQFFINVADNHFLDHRDNSMRGYGYAVFGHVIKGMDVVDKIVHTPTGARGPFSQNAPLKPVVIESIKRVH